MALTIEQLAAREGKLTASRVACLMGSDQAKILNLWRELVGDPAFVAEDLSGVWPVQLGSATENLHLDWIARKRGNVSRRGEVITMGIGREWAAATLDGWLDSHQCPVEVKHVGGFEKRADVIERYMPQVHWQMIVTDSPQCLFSVIEGAREPSSEFIPLDKQYADELWKRAEAFMECVKSLTPPVILAAVSAPVKAEKEYDYSTNNAFVSAAADWLQNKLNAKKFDDAEKEIKGLVPADAIRVVGGGLLVSRDRANRLKIVEK